MSWNPSMVREAYMEGPWLKLTRLKTKRKIKVWFEPHEYPEIITPLELETGEILTDSKGTRVQVIGVPGYGIETWTYKAYSIDILDVLEGE